MHIVQSYKLSEEALLEVFEEQSQHLGGNSYVFCTCWLHLYVLQSFDVIILVFYKSFKT